MEAKPSDMALGNAVLAVNAQPACAHQFAHSCNHGQQSEPGQEFNTKVFEHKTSTATALDLADSTLKTSFAMALPYPCPLHSSLHEVVQVLNSLLDHMPGAQAVTKTLCR